MGTQYLYLGVLRLAYGVRYAVSVLVTLVEIGNTHRDPKIGLKCFDHHSDTAAPSTRTSGVSAVDACHVILSGADPGFWSVVGRPEAWCISY